MRLVFFVEDCSNLRKKLISLGYTVKSKSFCKLVVQRHGEGHFSKFQDLANAPGPNTSTAIETQNDVAPAQNESLPAQNTQASASANTEQA